MPASVSLRGKRRSRAANPSSSRSRFIRSAASAWSSTVKSGRGRARGRAGAAAGCRPRGTCRPRRAAGIGRRPGRRCARRASISRRRAPAEREQQQPFGPHALRRSATRPATASVVVLPGAGARDDQQRALAVGRGRALRRVQLHLEHAFGSLPVLHGSGEDDRPRRVHIDVTRPRSATTHRSAWRARRRASRSRSGATARTSCGATCRWGAPPRSRPSSANPWGGCPTSSSTRPRRRTSSAGAGGPTDKPFCDGSHETDGFDGTETADRSDDRRAPVRVPSRRGDGSSFDLATCEHAGYCGDRFTNWRRMARRADDPAVRERLMQMVRLCPSGALRDAADGRRRAARAGAAGEHRGRARRAATGCAGGIPVTSADGADLRGAQPGDALPVRPFRDQAVLRRDAQARRLPRRMSGRRPPTRASSTAAR